MLLNNQMMSEPYISNRTRIMIRKKCIECGWGLCYIGLITLFGASVIGWNIQNISDPRRTLVEVYRECNHTIYICDIQPDICDTECKVFFVKMGNQVDSISVMIMLYWTCFFLGLLLFVITDTRFLALNMTYFMRQIFIYLSISIPVNTLFHF